MIKILDFYADWCGPCKVMAPMVEMIQKELPEVAFEKINVDSEEGIAARFGVQSIPTLIFYKDGVEVNRLIGFQSKDKILKTIANCY